MRNEDTVAFAALWASTHTLRIMVTRGLVSPNEVDEVHSSIIEAVQQGDPAFAAMIEARLELPFSEMKQWAEKRWIGTGKTEPR